MKRRIFLFCIMSVILVLLLAGCEEGNKYEIDDQVYIDLIVNTDSGEVDCTITRNYGGVEILVNGQELQFHRSDVAGKRYKGEISGLKEAENVDVNIILPSEGTIRETINVPESPDEIQIAGDLGELLKGNESQVRLSWKEVDCNKYTLFIEKEKGDIIYSASRMTEDNKLILYKDDLQIKKGETTFETPDKVTLYLYGTNEIIRKTPSVEIRILVFSPDKAEEIITE
jgi:hypothetical protein